MTRGLHDGPVDSHDGTLATVDEGALVALALGDATHRARSRQAHEGALARFGDIGALTEASPERLRVELGMSPRRARAFAATCELARRARSARDRSLPRVVRSRGDVARWASARIVALEHEELWLLALDARCVLRSSRLLARGGQSGLAVSARDVLRTVLLEGASAFVLVHNHPSGDPTPSDEDRAMSARIEVAARACGLALVDHVVVAARGHASALSEAP